MQCPQVAVRVFEPDVLDAPHVIDTAHRHTPRHQCIAGRVYVSHDQVQTFHGSGCHVGERAHAGSEDDGACGPRGRELHHPHRLAHLRVVEVAEADLFVERLGTVDIGDRYRHQLELHVGDGRQVGGGGHG